jgi:hypothetical protein
MTATEYLPQKEQQMNLIEVEIRNGGLYQKGFDSSLISSIAFLVGHQSGPSTASVGAYSSPYAPYGSTEVPPVTVLPDIADAYKKATAKARGMARQRGQAYRLSLFVNGHFYSSEKVGQEFNPTPDPNSKRSQKKAIQKAIEEAR